MSEEVSEQDLAAIAAARLKKMQRSQQHSIWDLVPKDPNPSPAKQIKPKTKKQNNYWDKSSSENIAKYPRHVADIFSNTPWISQPEVNDICAIAERPYNAWITLEAQHISDKWEKQRFIDSAYKWNFRAKMRCVAISQDGMATVSVSGVRKRLPLACLWEMNEIVDTTANSVYD
jgi:hypothetical protein